MIYPVTECIVDSIFTSLFASQDKLLVTSSKDGQVKFWNLNETTKHIKAMNASYHSTYIICV